MQRLSGRKVSLLLLMFTCLGRSWLNSFIFFEIKDLFSKAVLAERQQNLERNEKKQTNKNSEFNSVCGSKVPSQYQVQEMMVKCLSQSNTVYLETNCNNKMQGPDVPMKSSAPKAT